MGCGVWNILIADSFSGTPILTSIVEIFLSTVNRIKEMATWSLEILASRKGSNLKAIGLFDECHKGIVMSRARIYMH